jgi:hypothetical protein
MQSEAMKQEEIEALAREMAKGKNPLNRFSLAVLLTHFGGAFLCLTGFDVILEV